MPFFLTKAENGIIKKNIKNIIYFFQWQNPNISDSILFPNSRFLS